MRRKDNLSKSVRRVDPRFDRLGSGFGDATQASLFGGGGRCANRGSKNTGVGAGAASSSSSSGISANVKAGSSSANTKSALNTNSSNSKSNLITPSLVTKFKSTKKIETPREQQRGPGWRNMDREQSLLRKSFLSSHCANEKRRRECVKQQLDFLRKTCVESTDSKEEKPYVQTCTTVRLIEAAKQMIDRLVAQEQVYILEKEELEQKQCLLKGQLELVHESTDYDHEIHSSHHDHSQNYTLSHHSHGMSLDSSGYDSEETLDVDDIHLTPLGDEEDTHTEDVHLNSFQNLHHHHLPRVDVCSAYGPDPMSSMNMIKEEMFFDHQNHHNKTNGLDIGSGIDLEHLNHYLHSPTTPTATRSTSISSSTTSTDENDDNSSILASVIKIEDFQKFLADTNEFNVHEKLEYLDGNGCDYIAFEVEV